MTPEVPEDNNPTEVFAAIPRDPSQMPAAVPPTRELPTEAPVRVGPDGTAAPARSPFKTAMWVLAILLGVLVITVIAALVTRGGPSTPGVTASPSETPTASASPSVTPSPSPSVTPSPSPTPTETTEEPPPPSAPKFKSFTAPASVACADESSTAEVTISWESTSAKLAWVGIATNDAKAEPYSEVDTSGSATLPFPCSNESQVYTVTLEHANGTLNHQSATITRELG